MLRHPPKNASGKKKKKRDSLQMSRCVKLTEQWQKRDTDRGGEK